MATFVVAHGAWGGGWSWSLVRPLLRAAGHEIFTPTYTGLGERAHLATPWIDLSTHIQDVVAVLEYEDLQRVILVGHSYGGMVATGVAARVPWRLAQVVYVDAFVPTDGESLLDLVGITEAARFEALARSDGDGWRVPHAFPASPPMPGADRRCPHPLACFRQPISLSSNAGPDLPRTYVLCTNPSRGPFERFATRARINPAWRCIDFVTDHNPQYSAPGALAELLVGIASEVDGDPLTTPSSGVEANVR